MNPELPNDLIAASSRTASLNRKTVRQGNQAAANPGRDVNNNPARNKRQNNKDNGSSKDRDNPVRDRPPNRTAARRGINQDRRIRTKTIIRRSKAFEHKAKSHRSV